MKDFLSVTDFPQEQLKELLELSAEVKQKPARFASRLNGKNIAMLFAKPSTRTRVSFEVGINQLGGSPLYIDATTTQLGRGETIADMAKVLERYVDGIVARLYAHSDIEEIAANFKGPVVNALTDLLHPCQAVADIFTIREAFGKLEGVKLVYLGDGFNNVAHSLMLCSAMTGLDIVVSSPKELNPSKEITEKAEKIAEKNNSEITVENDVLKAVKGADVLYTDVWVSMGQKETEEKVKALKPYQLNQELVKATGKDARVMHCLPAHRGEEITDQAMDSANSLVFDQAENRLHTQKALLIKLFQK